MQKVYIMINYIKMDLFRLFKSVSFYVWSVILIFMTCLTIAEVKDIERGKEEYKEQTVGVEITYDEQDEEEEMRVSVGMYVDSLSIVEKGTLSGCIQSAYNGNVMIFIVLLIVSIFICNEFSNGYVKNVITIPKYRWYANISKLVTAFVVILIENIIEILVFLFAIKFVFKNVVIGDIAPLAGYLGLEMLMLLGLSSVVLLVSNTMRSKVAGIIAGLLIGLQIILFPIFSVLCGVLKYDVDNVAKYFMSATIGRIVPGMEMKAVMETLVLGIGATLVYTVLSNLVVSKNDVG